MATLLFGHISSGKTSLLLSGLHNFNSITDNLSVRFRCETQGCSENPYNRFVDALNGGERDTFFPYSSLQQNKITIVLSTHQNNIEVSYLSYKDESSNELSNADFLDIECNQILYLIDGNYLRNAYLNDNPKDFLKEIFKQDFSLMSNIQSIDKVEYLNIFVTKSDVPLCDYRLMGLLKKETIEDDIIAILKEHSLFEQCDTTISFVTLGKKLVKQATISSYNPYHTEYVYLLPMLNQVWWHCKRMSGIISDKLQKIEEIRQSSTRSKTDRLRLEAQVNDLLMPNLCKNIECLELLLNKITRKKTIYIKGTKSTFEEYYDPSTLIGSETIVPDYIINGVTL